MNSINRYELPDILTQVNVLDCFNAILKLINKDRPLIIDASQVTLIDCAGVALIVELLIHNKAPTTKIQIEQPSSAILNMCNLYNIPLS